MATVYQTNKPITFGVVINAKDTNLSTTAVEVMDVPAGFIATGCVIQEMEQAGAATNVTVKCGDTAIASAVAVGGSDLTKVYKAVTAGVFATDGAKVTVASAAAITSGKIRVDVVGFQAMGADYTPAGDNVAPADPYKQPEVA